MAQQQHSTIHVRLTNSSWSGDKSVPDIEKDETTQETKTMTKPSTCSLKGLGVKNGMSLQVLSAEVTNPYIRVTENNNAMPYFLDNKAFVAVISPGDYSTTQLQHWVNTIALSGSGVAVSVVRTLRYEAHFKITAAASNFKIPTAAESLDILRQQDGYTSRLNRSIWATLGFVLAETKSATSDTAPILISNRRLAPQGTPITAEELKSGYVAPFPVGNMWEREHDSAFDREQAKRMTESLEGIKNLYLFKRNAPKSLFLVIHGYSNGIQTIAVPNKLSDDDNINDVHHVASNISLLSAPPGFVATSTHNCIMTKSGHVDNKPVGGNLKYAIVDSSGNVVDMRGLHFLFRLIFFEPTIKKT